VTRWRGWPRRLAGSGGEALGERDFRRYWVGMVASEFALQMGAVAIGWQVYAIRGNPLDLGLVGLCEFLPLPLLALPAGHLADRLPRRAVMACARLLDIAVVACLLAVTLAGAEQLWPFFALAFATGVATAIGAPASRALVPSLVPAEKLAAAIAIRSVGWQAAVVVGPALGGLLFTVRPELVYIVAVGLTVASLASVLAIDAGRVVVVGQETPGFGSILAGVRLIRRTPVLFGAISLDLFAVLFGGAVALLPVFAKDVLHVGPAGLGLLRSAPAAGALAAALVLTRRPVGRLAGRKLLAVVALFGASMIVFGLSRAMWLSLIALVASGAADMVSVVLRQTIAPMVTPDELRGRVNAVEMVFISASNELGAFESGVAAALVGAVPAVLVGGAATVFVVVAWRFVFPQLARVDRLDELRPVAAQA
jgi:MFS family permease